MRQLDQIILKDDSTEIGGVDNEGETLLEFIESAQIKVENKYLLNIDDVIFINKKLKMCGIQELTFDDLSETSQEPQILDGFLHSSIQSNNTETSMKFDAGKTQYHLLVPSFVRRIAEVLTYSATHKYKPNSWQGLADSKNRYYDATMRHINEWWEHRRMEDPEDKIHPLIHAACNLMFLVYLDEHKEEQK